MELSERPARDPWSLVALGSGVLAHVTLVSPAVVGLLPAGAWGDPETVLGLLVVLPLLVSVISAISAVMLGLRAGRRRGADAGAPVLERAAVGLGVLALCAQLVLGVLVLFVVPFFLISF